MTHAEAGRPNSGGGTTLHEETERECRAQAAAEIRAHRQIGFPVTPRGRRARAGRGHLPVLPLSLSLTGPPLCPADRGPLTRRSPDRGPQAWRLMRVRLPGIMREWDARIWVEASRTMSSEDLHEQLTELPLRAIVAFAVRCAPGPAPGPRPDRVSPSRGR